MPVESCPSINISVSSCGAGVPPAISGAGETPTPQSRSNAWRSQAMFALSRPRSISCRSKSGCRSSSDLRPRPRSPAPASASPSPMRADIARKAGARHHSVQWVWPSALAYEARHETLKRFCVGLVDARGSFTTAGDPIEVGYAFVEQVLPGLLSETNLAGSFCKTIPDQP